MNDAFTAADLAAGALEDKAKGLPLGTTSVGKYGVLAAGFGIAEQLEIWEASDKKFEDFERFAIGISTNFPTPLSLGLMPKKWFDDNFDKGQNEADTLSTLLGWSKKLSNFFDGVGSAVNTFWNSAQNFIVRRDPLTFDLDGDGLETLGINSNNPILFDHDGDGIKNATGWVNSDDAFLVLDRNGNGTIDNGQELFGDSTIKSNGQTATDGFDALADLDTNSDGVIDANDAQFSNLRLWRDLNQDGISQSGELFTLNDLGITGINVAKTANSQTLANGNQVADKGTFILSDGTEGEMGSVTGDMADINLADNAFHREFPDQLDTSNVAHLPDMQGSGVVRDLREATTQSSTLQNLLTQFSTATTRDGQMAILDQLMDA
ncbi:MAG: hypothetical protein CVU35_07840 [Betaproteobacteria bacterium HGW-Betaproteobacteria-8]|nr:MAG: hypothetical protein CVU35_07840 [Betaproteobacteria bacterium HGW-Betaproteobacteria-8]PKO92559.1 MAG: hypothetical protein CVU15_05410 [Betaproteobacteria bacterium HGW-Betaproteobacteria-1]